MAKTGFPAMDAFGRAFDEEARLAEEKAVRAGRTAQVFIVLLAVIFATFFWLEFGKQSLDQDPAHLWHWAGIRISGVFFCAWFIAHFFRERKNFLHVAVANRHRRNLCNAYTAVAEKMTEDARLKYLQEILPQLSKLGKTGFISKEELPEAAPALLKQVLGKGE